MESHMTSMNNVGWDCREFFQRLFEGRPDEICDWNLGLH